MLHMHLIAVLYVFVPRSSLCLPLGCVGGELKRVCCMGCHSKALRPWTNHPNSLTNNWAVRMTQVQDSAKY